nr:unnamed protein product [Callosobruchus chinensis]
MTEDRLNALAVLSIEKKFGQSIPDFDNKVRHDIELDSLHGSWKCNSSNEQNAQQYVGKEGREIDHFACPFHSFPYAEVANDPHEEQSPCKLPTDRTHVLNALRYLQSSSPEIDHKY